MLLRAQDLARSFGARTLFRDVSLTVGAADRIGLVGPNGTGKTTLLRLLAGDEVPDSGRVTTPRGVRVGLLRQEIDPSRAGTVREEAARAFAALDALEAEMRDLEAQMERVGRDGADVPAPMAERYDRCRTAFEFGGGFEREVRLERMLEGLGFDAERRNRKLSAFSGGWIMRVELAKLLLAAPDVLLLDEPTNHLDLPSIQWFEATLADYGGAVVIVSHDRTFLRRHATRVAELERSELTLYEGGYDRYLVQKEERRAHLLARQRTQQREIAHTEKFIERFRYKASKARQVQSRLKALERMERIDVDSDTRARMRLRIPPVARSGDVSLRLEGIYKRYDETEVYRGVDLLVRRGDRIALVGPNGAGKSTLLRIAAGVIPIDAGERTPGHNVQIAFYAQHQLEALDAKRTVLEELESQAQVDDMPRLRGHLGAFLFSGDDVQKKVSVLSGGEKARLALAQLLLRPVNLLVLDEPTNHLDVSAREVLEEALSDYTGTLVFISHDRTLINALASRIVEVRAGSLRVFQGNYDDYLRAESQPEAPQARRARSEPTRAEPSREASEVGKAEPLDKRQRMEARERAKERTRAIERAKKRLAALEDEISSHEHELENLGYRLGDPAVYKDGEAVRELEARRSEVRTALDALYRDWERVAAELESAEQAP